ncbi:hypothetical protein GF386_02535, partial [Candidatus Pacearchaeota archaeon]|nr:hypothetical protein [Candidatus Pacearchaeota archaeon]MBD3283021.1 hypothetical protein [Candidatus Pacearchaeota archaeon]
MIKRVLIFVLILLSILLIGFYYPYLTGKAVVEYEPEEAFVKEVVDGDTIRTDIGEIRLLGINTPERGKTYYREASEFLEQVENQSIEVLRDYEEEDRYNRKLRYVFFNGRFMNIELLEKGLATSFMLDDLKFKDKLVRAEDSARNQKIGLWEKSRDFCADCIKLVELDPEEEFFILKNICDIDCKLDGWLVKDDANHFFKLNDLKAFNSERYRSKNRIW